MTKHHDCIGHLVRAGIDYDDALALRRIAMTLHRWHELECGDGNDYASWSIERDEADGKPYLCTYHHQPYRYADGTCAGPSKHRIADREAGALRRLGEILKRYPGLSAYQQGDPRGAALYILRPGDVPEGERAESWYSRGIAVYK